VQNKLLNSYFKVFAPQKACFSAMPDESLHKSCTTKTPTLLVRSLFIGYF